MMCQPRGGLMFPKERRRHFLIDKPLQFRYMSTIVLTLSVVTFVALINLYFAIWGGVLNAFSDEQIRNDLLTASRIQEYEEARRPLVEPDVPFSILSLFRQAERLSERQREVFKDLLNQSNQRLAGKLLLLLLLIAWGTIFLSHKIAGPLYRFHQIFCDLHDKNLSVRCHLRKFDEAKPLAEALNQTLESLDASITRLKKIAGDEKLSLEQLLSNLRAELSQFKTSADR